MKRTTLVFAAVLATAAIAHAVTATWTGRINSNWQTPANWSGFTVPVPPGTSDDIVIDAANLIVAQTPTTQYNYMSGPAADYQSMTITSDANDSMTLQITSTVANNDFGTLALNGFSSSRVSSVEADESASAGATTVRSYGVIDVLTDKTFTVSSVSIDADAQSAISQLESKGAGTFDSSGQMLIKADQDAANDAIYKLSDGQTFTPDSVKFDGSGSVANGEAIIDANRSITVTNDTVVDGYAQLDIATTYAYTTQRMDVDANLAMEETRMNLIGQGTVDANSTVLIKADQAMTPLYDAILVVNVSTFTPSSLELFGSTDMTNAHAILDADQSFSVDDNGGDDVVVKGMATIEVADSVTVNLRDLDIRSADSGDLLILGQGANSTVTVKSDASFGTNALNGQPLRLEAPSGGNAELIFKVQ